MQKQLEGTQKYVNEQCRWVHISMGNSCNYCEQCTRFQPEVSYKVIKPTITFTNVCRVSGATTFSAPPQILAASLIFFCPIPETKKWVMVSFGATAAGLF